MILQALKEYYDRKAADNNSDIAPEGFERKQIPFLIVIDANGEFINLEDTREMTGKKAIAKTFLVPRSKSRSGSRSHEITFFLWDHIGYLLSYPEDNQKAVSQHKTWLHSLSDLPDTLKNNAGISAMIKFYESFGVNKVKEHPTWAECTKTLSCNMTFKLLGDNVPIPCSPIVQDYIRRAVQSLPADITEDQEEIVIGRCLVTGEIGEIVRVHSDTRISKDAKKLVGFQKNSGYDSYGKEQGYNAPVCKSAEFAYTTALNTLLKSSSRMLIGDAITVFWSEKDSEFAEQFGNFFNEPPPDNPDRGIEAVKSLFKAVESGAFNIQSNQRFYVLGLAPNSARIAVRIWIVDTVAGMAEKIAQHFKDLKIVHGPRDRDVLSLFRLLVSIAVLGKSENIPANLAGEIMRSILTGLPYPQTLLQAVIRRIRAERDITYPRAALIKAFINRVVRLKNANIKEELKMSLDESNTNIGYLLGRLFSTLEKIQSEANPGINATIRDRYYAAASGTPVTVFGNLMRLKNHHLAKLDNPGRRIFFEKLIGVIMEGVDSKSAFPAHLSLDDQGRFAIGYYHQMQDFYTKKTDRKETN